MYPMPTISPFLWAGFLGFILLMLLLDLGVFHRKAHAVSFREATIWTGVWVSLAMLFNLLVLHLYGRNVALEFLAGYLVEESLSVDNIFVFVIIFASLGIPAAYQHRVLFWGILSALVLRAAMIFAGAALLQRFHWLIYFFGAFLILTGIRVYMQRNAEHDIERSWGMRVVQRAIPSTKRYEGGRFFVKENGRWLATPLFVALVLIEITDIIFAVDSIPAVFAITENTFIVFTSNIFAILGLRSLFFLVAGLVDKFCYLKTGLAGVLVFVGIKMSVADIHKINPAISLLVIALILGSSVVASLWVSRSRKSTHRSHAHKKLNQVAS